MESQETLREAARLRLRFQMNNRLRLESLAALSKVFRDYGEPVSDDLLASLTFAVPTELHGNGDGHGHSNGNGHDATEAAGTVSASPGVPPPGKPSGVPPPGKPSGVPPPGKPSGVPPPGKPSGVPPPGKSS